MLLTVALSLNLTRMKQTWVRLDRMVRSVLGKTTNKIRIGKLKGAEMSVTVSPGGNLHTFQSRMVGHQDIPLF